LSYRSASLCSLATQFQTRFLESIPRLIAGLKFSAQSNCSSFNSKPTPSSPTPLSEPNNLYLYFKNPKNSSRVPDILITFCYTKLNGTYCKTEGGLTLQDLFDFVVQYGYARQIFGKLNQEEPQHPFSAWKNKLGKAFSQPNRIFRTKNILYDFFCSLQVVFIAYHYVKTHSELNCSYSLNIVVKQKKAPSNSHPL
jgi:hypothetical protein